MSKTENLHLKKPAQEDYYNVDDFNDNADIIDDAIHTIEQNVDGKVDKVTGKGLSTHDLTNNLKMNYDLAYEAMHTHTNKSVIDDISEDTVSQINTNKEDIKKINDSQIGENLIPIPYAEITTEGNIYKGITYKNTNGVINLTGTVQDRFSFRSLNSKTDGLIILEHGYYTLSGCPETANNVVALCVLKGDTTATETNFKAAIKDVGNGVVIDNTTGDYDSGVRICIVCFGTDTVIDDINVYPMLERGSVYHDYQLYTLSRQCMRADIDALMAVMLDTDTE